MGTVVKLQTIERTSILNKFGIYFSTGWNVKGISCYKLFGVADTERQTWENALRICQGWVNDQTSRLFLKLILILILEKTVSLKREY